MLLPHFMKANGQVFLDRDYLEGEGSALGNETHNTMNLIIIQLQQRLYLFVKFLYLGNLLGS